MVYATLANTLKLFH